MYSILRTLRPISVLMVWGLALSFSNPALATTAPFDVSVTVFNCQDVKSIVDPETGEVQVTNITQNYRQSVDIISADLNVPAEDGKVARGCVRSYDRTGKDATTFKKLDEMIVNYKVWRSGKPNIGNRITIEARFTPRTRTYGTDFNFPLELTMPDTEGEIRNGMHFTNNLCEDERDESNKLFVVSVRKANPDAKGGPKGSDPYVFNNQPCDGSVKEVTQEVRDRACEFRRAERTSWCREDNEWANLNSDYCTKDETALCADIYKKVK